MHSRTCFFPSDSFLWLWILLGILELRLRQMLIEATAITDGLKYISSLSIMHERAINVESLSKSETLFNGFAPRIKLMKASWVGAVTSAYKVSVVIFSAKFVMACLSFLLRLQIKLPGEIGITSNNWLEMKIHARPVLVLFSGKSDVWTSRDSFTLFSWSTTRL